MFRHFDAVLSATGAQNLQVNGRVQSQCSTCSKKAETVFVFPVVRIKEHTFHFMSLDSHSSGSV
jgi:hypothetical protein